MQSHQAPKPSSSKRITLLAAVIILSVPIYLILSSYFQIDLGASIIFHGDDGWCRVGPESIGRHCFGDWNERVGLDYSIPDPRGLPYHNNMELSPIGPYITFAGNIITGLMGGKVTLIAVCLLYTYLILFPFIKRCLLLSREDTAADTALLRLGALCPLASIPLLAAVDRLNNVALLVPILYLASCKLVAGRSFAYKLLILAACIIKPQMILYYFVDASTLAGLLGAILCTTLAIIVLLVLVLIPAAGDLNRISEYTQAISSYSNSFRDPLSLYPPNISGFRVLGFMHDSSALILILIAVISLVSLRKEPPFVRFLVLSILICFFSGAYIAPYYLVILLPFAAYLLFPIRRSEVKCPMLISSFIYNRYRSNKADKDCHFQAYSIKNFLGRVYACLAMMHAALPRLLLISILCITMKPPMFPLGFDPRHHVQASSGASLTYMAFADYLALSILAVCFIIAFLSQCSKDRHASIGLLFED